MNELIQKYIDQLTTQEKLAFNIAKEHLGSSFDIEKSIGFKNWLQKNISR